MSKILRTAVAFCICVLFFLLTLINQSSAECVVPENLYQEIEQLILESSYSGAEEIIDRFILNLPDEPAGPLLKAAVLQYECTDYEDFSRQEEFYSLLARAKDCAQQKLVGDAGDIWARYFFSASESLEGAWMVASGSLIKGLLQGRSGAKGMTAIVEMDSTFYDAWLMLGSYHFWYSSAIEPVDWLPFVKADASSGIEKVERAIKNGKLTGPLSNTVLLEMLLADDPEQAVELGERMTAHYPDCRLFAWQLGEAYKKQLRYDDAVSVFTSIAMSMASDKADDGSGQLRCWWKCAELSKTVGKHKECLNYCNEVLRLSARPSVDRRQAKRISRAENLKKEIENGN